MEYTLSPPFRRASADTHGYERARSGRNKHRSRSRSWPRFRYLMDQFEHADSQPVDGPLAPPSQSRYFPKTWYRKDSTSNPSSQNHHHIASDMKEQSSYGPSKTGVETRVFDAVHDPSLSSKDISIRLDIPVEQDLGPYLEDFCRFRRLGLFREARDVYQLRLAQHSTIPYVFVQYAEMLVVSGDYKSFQELIYPEKDEGKKQNDSAEDKLRTNYELLRLLARSPVWSYTLAAMEIVRGVLEDLKDEQVMGSTEVQLLSLCFQILSYLKASSHHQVVAQAIQDAKGIMDLELLYYHLLGEARIWDFRDLFISAVSLFGWPGAISMLFHSTDSNAALARIHEDWSQLGDGESIILGLLDIFTSLMLQSRPLDKKARPASLSLVEHARVLAESAQKDNADNMNTRPFIQWILAKTLWETPPAPKRRPDGATIEDFQGLLLDQGDDLHLPVFVPVNDSEKPDWGLVAARPSAAHRSAVEVALGAAMQADDFHLQALALKVLCLQSQDPTRFMDVLSTLQLDLQGDMEGYLGTCLARYLVPQGSTEAGEKRLLRRFKQLDNVSDNSYLHSGVNPSLLWARDVIQGHILARFTSGQGGKPSWERNLRIYGPRLPQYIATFIEDHFRLNIPPPMRVSFNIIGDENTQQGNGIRSALRTDSMRVLSQQWIKPNHTATTDKPQGQDTSSKRFTPQSMPSRREGRSERPRSPHDRFHDLGSERSYRGFADDRYGDHGYSTKIPRGVKVDNHVSELSFSSGLLKDNTVTVIVRNKINPKKVASYQMNTTGVFDVTLEGETDDIELEEEHNEAKITQETKVDEDIGRYDYSDDESLASTGIDIRVHRVPPPRPGPPIRVRTLSPTRRESSASSDIDIRVHRAPPPGMRRPPPRLPSPARDRNPAFFQSVSRSEFDQTRRKPYEWMAPPRLLRQSSFPQPAMKAQLDDQSHDPGKARPKRTNTNGSNTIDGKRTEPTTKHNNQHLAKSTGRTQNTSTGRAGKKDHQPEPVALEKKGAERPKNGAQKNHKEPPKLLSEEVIGQLNSELRPKRRETWDTRAETMSNPELLGTLPSEFDGQRDDDLDDSEPGDHDEPLELPTNHNARMDPVPGPPLRRSTVENADDEEGWHRPVEAREAKVNSTDTPSKSEEVSAEGLAQTSSNPAANSQKPLENTEGYFQDDVAQKMNEALEGAKGYMDQPKDSC